MKRLIAIVLSTALFLSGCAQAAEPSESASELPQGVATVLGRVNSISGNDIVLTLGTYGSTQNSAAAQPQASGDAAPTDDTSASGASSNGRGARSQGAGSSADEAAPAAEAGSGGPPAAGGDMPSPEGDTPPSGETGGRGSGKGSGSTQNVTFRESGETLSVRIPVGTPIAYGSLKVDFSQLQTNYIVSLTLGGADGETVVAGEILST